MPGGDVNISLLRRLQNLATQCGLEEFSLVPLTASDSAVPIELKGLEPPYVGVKGRLSGSGSFRQLGRFLAEFENSFPFFRATNLRLGKASESRLVVRTDDTTEVLYLTIEFEGCPQPGSIL